MQDIITAIMNLDRIKMSLFLMSLDESESTNKINALLRIIKANPDCHEDFFNAIPTMWKNHLKKALLDTIANKEMLSADKEVIKQSFSELDQVLCNYQKDDELAQKMMQDYRDCLKARCHQLSGKQLLSDQMKGIKAPAKHYVATTGATCIDLPLATSATITNNDVYACISERQSRRAFNDQALSMEQLAWLLWATQGVRKNPENAPWQMKTVPSAGARHPFETYLAINHVVGIKPGLYRYLPFTHQLELMFTDDQQKENMAYNANGQKFAGDCAICFIWTALPYRTEWRYMLESKKCILIDVGHVGQNLYTACESIGAGTCAIAAYRQDAIDKWLRLDTANEFVVYLSPVGFPLGSN